MQPGDCDYLLDAVNRVFPGSAPDRGGHPLHLGRHPPPGAGQDGERLPAVSRKHLFQDSGTGLVTIAGGKLTTFRTMAWEMLDRCSSPGYLRALRGPEKPGGTSPGGLSRTA